MITILGPTASGKTLLAASVASRLDGEIISADSRQVFRHMTIGTGKDYSDYTVEGKTIPCHLVDIAEPGTEYNIFRFQQDFLEAFHDIKRRGKLPLLCGGSGMYLEAVLKGYHLPEATPSEAFLDLLQNKTDAELEALLRARKPLHNKTDLESRERMIMALSIISETSANNPGRATNYSFPDITSQIFGISLPRSLVKQRITNRLQFRLENGMLEEIQQLLSMGITPERLMRYGLEYKFGTMFIIGRISRDELLTGLNQAIHQFSKRQMTWFRRMERQGLRIHWIDGRQDLSDMISEVIIHCQNNPA
jgi:tRNA dimethylallyltransferase